MSALRAVILIDSTFLDYLRERYDNKAVYCLIGLRECRFVVLVLVCNSGILVLEFYGIDQSWHQIELISGQEE